MEASPSNTCSHVVIRREEFVNQFRIAFIDECGRPMDWRFQVGEPVYYHDDTVSGYTFIKSISAVGFFTVNAAPTTKNDGAFAQKYIDNIPLDRIREFVEAGAVPQSESCKWEKWVSLQDCMEVLYCQSGKCNRHEIRRWKLQELLKDMTCYDTSLEGYVICRPCATTLGYLPAKRNICCPYPCNGPASKFANCPWRKTDQENALAILHGRYKQLLDEKLAELVTAPESERQAKSRDITSEVTGKYQAACSRTLSEMGACCDR